MYPKQGTALVLYWCVLYDGAVPALPSDLARTSHFRIAPSHNIVLAPGPIANPK